MPPLRILTAADVTSILSTLPTPLALRSQSTVFIASSRQSRAAAAPNEALAIQTPVRLVVSSEEMKMLFMPARAPTDVSGASVDGEARSGRDKDETVTTTAVKIVSVPTKGSTEGLPGTTLILDEVSGRVKAVINARRLTTLRNACGSALFLSLYPPTTTTSHLLIFGSGAQAQTHTTLFLRLYPSLSRVTFIVRSPTPRSSSLVQDLASQHPDVKFTAAVHPSPSAELTELVGKADIILTATSSLTPLFASSAAVPRPGARVIMIGSYKPEMHEVDGDLLKRASTVVVDSSEAVEVEAGEFIDVGLGQVAGGKGCVELGDVLDGVVPVREDEKQGVVVFKSVGVGIQDVAIAKLVLDEAERHNIGTIVPDYD